MSSSPTVVYVVEDDPGFGEGLGPLLRDVGVSTKSFDGAQAFVDAYPELSPGCVFVDLRPGMSGLDLLRQLRAGGCRWPVILLTGEGSTLGAADAIRAGAFAFLEKPLRALEVLAVVYRAQAHLNGDIQTLPNEEIAARVQHLSRREREVFDGVLQGLLNKQIAGRLGISESAVKSARRGLMSRMRARSKVDLVLLALRGGLIVRTRS
jgi:FixJ family two-component response regulator